MSDLVKSSGNNLMLTNSKLVAFLMKSTGLVEKEVVSGLMSIEQEAEEGRFDTVRNFIGRQVPALESLAQEYLLKTISAKGMDQDHYLELYMKLQDVQRKSAITYAKLAETGLDIQLKKKLLREKDLDIKLKKKELKKK